MTLSEKILAACGGFLVLGATLTMIMKSLVWINRTLTKVNTFLDQWFGHPAADGEPPTPSFPAQMRTVVATQADHGARLAAIEHGMGSRVEVHR